MNSIENIINNIKKIEISSDSDINNSINNNNNNYLKPPSKKNILIEKNFVSDSSSKNIKINDKKKSSKKKSVPIPNNSALLEKLQTEINTLSYQNDILNKKNIDLKEELEQLNKNIKTMNENHNNEILLLYEKITQSQFRLNSKEEEIKKLNETIENNKKSIIDYDSIKLENKKLNFEINNLKKTIDNLNNFIKNLQKNISSNQDKFNREKTENDLNKKERVFIMNEAFVSKEKNKELELNIKKLEKENENLKELNKNLITKIETYDKTKEKEFREKFEKEKENLKNKYKKDVEELNKNLNNLHQNKIDLLNEQNFELKKKNNEDNKTLKNLNNTLNLNNLENKNQINALNEKISFNKIKENLKEIEINRLNNVNNNNFEIINLLQNENKSLKEKNILYQKEIEKISFNSYNEVQKLKEKIIYIENLNKNYEQNESELDNVLNNNMIKSINDDKLIKAMETLPMNKKKRTSQCLILAQRLKEVIIENNKLNNEIKNLENEKNSFKEQKEIYENINEKAQEPYDFILKKLNKNELLLKDKSNELEDLKNRFKVVMEENKNLNEKYNEIENDLRIVLLNREKIDRLNEIVNNYIQQENNQRTQNNFFQTKNLFQK